MVNGAAVLGMEDPKQHQAVVLIAQHVQELARQMASGVVMGHAQEVGYVALAQRKHANTAAQKPALQDASGTPAIAAGQNATAFIVPELFNPKTAVIAEHKQKPARQMANGVPTVLAPDRKSVV